MGVHRVPTKTPAKIELWTRLLIWLQLPIIAVLGHFARHGDGVTAVPQLVRAIIGLQILISFLVVVFACPCIAFCIFLAKPTLRAGIVLLGLEMLLIYTASIALLPAVQ